MENKSLKTIQTLAKIGKVISKIIFICCIIGIVGCVIGLGGVIFANSDYVQQRVHYMVFPGYTFAKTLFAIITGIICCVAECILAKRAEKYFRNELEAGTPFTLEGALEMKKLGIAVIVASVVCTVLVSAAYTVLEHFFGKLPDMDMEAYSGVALGITFIIVSIILKCATEEKNKLAFQMRNIKD